MDVTYKFTLDQKVVTQLGDEGIITMLGFDEGGQRYYVETRNNSSWLKEAHLNERQA